MTDQTTQQQTDTADLSLPRWQALLDQRGILAPALECGVKIKTLYGHVGWQYPMFKSNGQPAHARQGVQIYRWKDFDSTADVKYQWDPKDPEDGKPWSKPPFYFPPGFVDAVKAADGRAVWASGEPDVWAWMASGHRNVFCWFGENSVPDSLVTMLNTLGITFLSMYPDLDKTGCIAAAKVHKILREANIEHRISLLDQTTLGEGGDINKLWVYSEFNPEVFDIHLDVTTDVQQAFYNESAYNSAKHNDGNMQSIWAGAGKSVETFWEIVMSLENHPKDAQEAVSEPAPATNTHDKANGWSDDEYNGFLSRAWAWMVNDCGVHEFSKSSSKRFACTIASHSEDDKRPAAYLYKSSEPESGCYCCPKCGVSLNIKDYLAARGKDPKDFYPVRPNGTKQPPHDGTAPAEDKRSWLVGWLKASDEYDNILEGNVPARGQAPLPIPFKAMARMGGLAKLIEPGTVFGFVSGSGWGKTVFVETLIDFWRQLGFNGSIWGPEWPPTKYVTRAVQRQGGPSVSRLSEHKSFYADARRGVPLEQRRDSPLSATEIELGRRLKEMILGWPGDLVIIDHASVNPQSLCGERGGFQESANGFREYGRKLHFAVFDYANLVFPEDGNKGETLDESLYRFKAFCSMNDVVGVTNFQIDKATSQRVLQGKTDVSLESMLGARSFTMNLCVGMWRDLVEETGEYSATGHFRVTKNSEGKNGLFDLLFVEERALWADIAETIEP